MLDEKLYLVKTFFPNSEEMFYFYFQNEREATKATMLLKTITEVVRKDDDAFCHASFPEEVEATLKIKKVYDIYENLLDFVENNSVYQKYFADLNANTYSRR
ncbi:MAG: hypothetical protein E7374_03525 [Clostridiales bacterium]|nr:hypothetical protein [Clostridiales bacterium]